MLTETEVSLIFEYPYEEKEELFTPVATIEIAQFESYGDKQETYKAIVDTGSEVTIISVEIAKKFDFPMTNSSQKIDFAGVSNGISTTPYFVRLRFKHHKFQENDFHAIKCYCCERKFLSQDIILGMNFLNKFEITFSGKYKKITIVENLQN